MQHLCVETARIINDDDPDWERTAAGRLYSYKYGFGVLDASRYVRAAQSWKLVKPQSWFHSKTIQIAEGTMNASNTFTGGQLIGKGGIKSTVTVSKQMLIDNNFESLEHINIRVWISHTKRGDVEVEVVSPHGVKSVLASTRQVDQADTGYPGWSFMSVKHW